MSAAEREGRYDRQTIIPTIGESGQKRLLSSSVLVAGLGGLGSPVALYLAAAGVGHLGLADDDVVSESNLQRQIIHGVAALGRKKAESAAGRVRDLNPDVRVTIHRERVTRANVVSVIHGYNVVVGCLDNMESRYTLNEACVGAGVPLVEGGVMRFSGMVTTIVPGKGPCYRCIFPAMPDAGVMEQASAGVLGPAPGVIGSIQAMEAVKLILGIGEPLIGRLLLVDLLLGSFKEVEATRNPACPVCGGRR